MNEDLTFQALRQLQANPQLSQRQLVKALGISLGRTHYCLRALIDRGWIKIQNFRNSCNKRARPPLIRIQARCRVDQGRRA